MSNPLVLGFLDDPVRMVVEEDGLMRTIAARPAPSDAWEMHAQARTASAETVRLLGAWLNDIHRCDHTYRYWNLAVGRFVRELVHVVQYRVAALDQLSLNDHSEISLSLPASGELNPPRTVVDGMKLLWYSVEANTQLLGTILRERGVATHWRRPKHKGPLQGEGEQRASRANGEQGQVWTRQVATRYWLNVQRRLGRDRVLLFGAGLLFPTRIRLALLSRGRVVPAAYYPLAQSAPEPDLGLRSTLPTWSSSDSLMRPVLNCLQQLAPTLVVEGHHQLHDKASHLLRNGVPAAIVAPPDDETHSHLVAEAAARGAKVAFSQHGAHYGETVPTPLEDHERSAGDELISWGWHGSRVRPLPSPRLMAFRKEVGRRRSSRTGWKILWVTEPSRVFLLLEPPFVSFEEYAKTQHEFVRHLPKEVERKVIVRLRPPLVHHDPLRGYEWLDRTEVKLEAGVENIAHLIADASLVFVDRPFSTAFLQCLAVDRPVITFGSGARSYVRPSALATFDRLVEVGVIVDGAEAAAGAVSRVLEDPIGWWRQPARAKAVSAAREQFAYVGRHPMLEWARYLREFAARRTR